MPTVTFNALHVFFVLSLERPRILHVNVTAHPYAAWSAQQIVEAVGPDADVVRLIRDRDAIYGGRARPKPRYRTAPHLAEIPLAERVRGTVGRHPSSRAAWSRGRAWRASSPALGPPARRVLQRGPPAHGAQRRRAGPSRGRAE